LKNLKQIKRKPKQFLKPKQ